MHVRRATAADLDRAMELYDLARAFMRANGNDAQWVNGYPTRADAEADLTAGDLLACEGNGGEVLAVMTYVEGPDETYGYIENGAWLAERPYHVVHRLAVGASGRGVGGFCLRWAVADAALRGHDLRCDTHELNLPMRRALDRAGLVECGTIYVSDGTPRLAFQTP